MSKKEANLVSGGSILAMLLIAQLPLGLSLGILGISGLGLAYINRKNQD